jgi:hypothetical protein
LSIVAQTHALRQECARLAAKPEWDLLTRYDLLGKKPPSSLKERVWRGARRLLAALSLVPPQVTKYPWQPTLKHALASAEAGTILIWALGADRDALRAACERFSARLNTGVALVPVLVTDVADFAYFSRLGWLVEYLPELDGDGQSYRARKRAYLAWRYRDACIVPLDAALTSDTEWHALLQVG